MWRPNFKASGFGYSGDDFVPQIQPAAWQRLGMTVQLLEEVLDELEERLVEAKNFSIELQTADEPDA